MFNLQGSEIIVILLLALVVLGPEKLPDAIRRFSQTYAELKKMGTGFQSELKSALDEPMREMRETADLVRNAADPEQMVEQAEAEAAERARTEAAAKPIDDRAFLVNDPAADRAAGDESVADVTPINQIAAANSSASLAAAAVPAAAEAADTNSDGGDTDADPEADDRAADEPVTGPAPPSGPAFHSAAPAARSSSAQGNGAEPETPGPDADVPAADTPAPHGTDAVDDSAGHDTEASEEANAS